MMKTQCPGHMRHWFAPAAYIRSPVCVRCGATNPKPLPSDELSEYEDYKKRRNARAA